MPAPNVNKTNSVAFSLQVNYTDRMTSAAGEVSVNFLGTGFVCVCVVSTTDPHDC
jgi:hypothetical protein